MSESSDAAAGRMGSTPAPPGPVPPSDGDGRSSAASPGAAVSSAASASASSARLPRQIPFIIANEACERFSFYGMRNILTPFLVGSLLLDAPAAERAGLAKEVFHTFVIGVYFFPLLGGILSDRFFGKYRTVLSLSLVYVLGHACLAAFEHQRLGFYAGLALIAVGSGGIKPLVASFVGDQFSHANKHLAKRVFDAFYWAINFGSFFASLLMPILLRAYGPRVAFGIPGLLMAIATIVFWSGRHRYVHTPLAPPDPHSFSRVVRTALTERAPGRPRTGLGLLYAGAALALAALGLTGSLGVVAAFCLALVLVLAFGGVGAWLGLERAAARHPAAAVDGVRSVLRLLVVFALVTPFWSLFDQKASTWILQADQMTKPAWFQSAQMQALNPALVMLLIPFNGLVLYPALGRLGKPPSALGRMGTGIAFAAAAWICAGVIQLGLDGGEALSIAWQMLPYALLTLGEVLVATTGLEFAYSQAPASMKGVIMAFWTLAVTVGNLWVLLANASVRHEAVISSIARTGLSETAFLMFFFAAFALVVAAVFALYARGYPMRDHYRA
jgi:proton-dependent oligopeptide transporter, POT family